MEKQHSFSGQKNVFGILTTLDEWKICWLPESNDAAISGELLDDFTENENEFEFDRKINSSRIYKHNERNLATLILSVIVKSYYSPSFPVNLFSTKRHYIRLTSEHWLWTKYSNTELRNMNREISLDVPHAGTSSFTIIKYFYSGTYSKVRLCISDKGNIAVIKNFIGVSEEIPNQELECWKKINKKRVYISAICNDYGLVMPLVFNIHVDNKNKRIYIPLNLNNWFFEDGAIPGDLPDYLKDINNVLTTLEYNIRDIIETAILKCSNAGYFHDDLELRHIAVYPNIDNVGNVSLEPVLIDFGNMKKLTNHDSEEIMLLTINEKLNEYLASGYIIG